MMQRSTAVEYALRRAEPQSEQDPGAEAYLRQFLNDRGRYLRKSPGFLHRVELQGIQPTPQHQLAVEVSVWESYTEEFIARCFEVARRSPASLREAARTVVKRMLEEMYAGYTTSVSKSARGLLRGETYAYQRTVEYATAQTMLALQDRIDEGLR